MTVKRQPRIRRTPEPQAAAAAAAVAALGRAQELVEDALSSALDAAAAQAGPTVAELTAGSGVSVDAVVAFITTANELLGDTPLSVEAARRAAVVAVSSHAWERELGPLLSTKDVGVLLGGVTRQRVDELMQKHRIIGMQERNGRWRYPAFQFHDGRIDRPLATAFWTLVETPLNPWSAAAWCVAPDDALDGQTPVEWLRSGGDPDRLIRLATQDAARLAR